MTSIEKTTSTRSIFRVIVQHKVTLIATEMRLQDTKGKINVYITEWIKYNKHQYYFESGVFCITCILNKEVCF